MSLYQEEIENHTEITITVCQTQEAFQRLICHMLRCLPSYFSYEKTTIHTIDTDVMILLIAYLSDILRKNFNVLVYAKMVKSGVYHDIRTMILALDHPTSVALPFCFCFFLHSLAETQCPSFILKENVRDGMPRCKIVPTLIRYSFILGINHQRATTSEGQ